MVARSLITVNNDLRPQPRPETHLDSDWLYFNFGGNSSVYTINQNSINSTTSNPRMDPPSSKQLSQEFNFSGTNNSSSAFVRAKGNFLKILRIPKLNSHSNQLVFLILTHKQLQLPNRIIYINAYN